MDDAFRVRGFERGCDLARDVERLGDRQSAAREPLRRAGAGRQDDPAASVEHRPDLLRPGFHAELDPDREAPALGLDLPLDVRGTAFQQRVWQSLRKIPAGSTASYTDVAKLIGSPNSVRAVAQACGANTLAVAIPCHRVVRNDGALSGYRWGVERKRALLEKEAHA